MIRIIEVPSLMFLTTELSFKVQLRRFTELHSDSMYKKNFFCYYYNAFFFFFLHITLQHKIRVALVVDLETILLLNCKTEHS